MLVEETHTRRCDKVTTVITGSLRKKSKKEGRSERSERERKE